MTSLRDILRGSSFTNEVFAALFDAGATQLPFLCEDDQASLRERVARQLASSQELSSERVVTLLQAKIAILEGMKI